MSEAFTTGSGEQAGAQIGRYKLLEQIGEGGMGTIWMAEQREPVKRRVALKIIKLGMDTKQVIARFEAERQALALMDHPHIAKVHDAGTTDSGRPYFVMEYIRGVPILEYCDREKLDTQARLEIFTSVCHAIQHAHQKGIIHRDIKPSNVLVTFHDGVPVPKVIDFGIAKATNSELTTRTLFTEHRQMIGTPAYMSPEQAEMSGLDIDTRSDVYSLGVLLYELLTGTTPFDIQALLESGFNEMLRAIREDEPHKPSTRISSLGDTGTRTALQRKVDAKKLSSLLRGDIDWIVMKCLEKDRSRRYDTANALAADIGRHLAHEPVSAGAPSAGYRLRKFVRRNRGSVLAVSAVATALLFGIVASVWQAREAGRQRDLARDAQKAEAGQRTIAEAARTEALAQEAKAKLQEAEARKQAEEARQQAAIAAAVGKFQTDTLGAADPDKLLGERVTVVQAMEAAVKVLDSGALADQPLVEAGVRETIGRSLDQLGRYDDAEPNLRKSLELRRAALPAGHRGIAEGLHDLAALLLAQSRLPEAESLAREALEIERAAVPAGHPGIALVESTLAQVLREQNEFDEAGPLFKEALEINRAALPAGHPDIASCLVNLAYFHQSQNEPAQAEAFFREALDIRRAVLPAQHPDVASALTRFAAFLRDQNRAAEAEPLYREALEIRRATLPAGHPSIANELNSLALLLHYQHRLDEAEQDFREALKIWRASLPAGHPQTGICLSNLAILLKDKNEYAEAEPLQREALGILRAAFPAGHRYIASAVNNLAVLLMSKQDPAGAEPLFRESLEMRRATLPAGHPDLATGLSNLAFVLKSQQKLAEAEPLVREALEISRAALPAGHPKIAGHLTALAVLLKEQGKLGEAEPFLRQAVDILRAAYPPGHPDIANGLTNLGALLQAAKKLGEAEPLLREALELGRTAHPPGHPRLITAIRNLADLEAEQGQTGDAAALYLEVLESSRAKLGKESSELSALLASLGQSLLKAKAWDDAEPLLRECLAIREKIAPDGWTAFHAKSQLGAALLGQGQLAEAEPLLLAGYRGMEQREASIPRQSAARVPEALERLVQLYEALGNAGEAAAWRSQLEGAERVKR